jgi:formylglycine-generating enzyme required for sulfatase activity
MNNGDLLTGTLGEKELTLQTEYADFPVPLEDIQKIEMRRGEESSVVLTMMNEDHVRGTLTMETLSLRLDVGAGIDSVYKDEFDTIHLHDGLRELTYKKGVGNSVFRPENVSVINEIGMELIYIPAGTFMMGSPESEEGRDGDEGPVHKVTLTDPFYMGKYEVTQSQYEEVMRRNPSKYVDEDLPVEQVSWYYARIFCTRLSASDEQFDYRLPTEAEWEYACRAGTRSPFYWGDIWDDEYG